MLLVRARRVFDPRGQLFEFRSRVAILLLVEQNLRAAFLQIPSWLGIFAAHRSDDLTTALRIAKEFNLNARLDLATEGYLMAADLSGTPVYGQAGVVQSGQHSYLSWFVGYRGSLAVAVLETGTTAAQAAAALAGTFLGNVG